MRETSPDSLEENEDVRVFSDVLAMYAPLVFSGLVDHQTFTCIFILHAKTNPAYGGKRRGSAPAPDRS